MKRYLIYLILLLCPLCIRSQQEQYLKFSCEEIETLFLANNLELIAERYDISIADAEIIQAKHWENPSLSLGDMNFWRSEKQFSIELSQLIQTANKRRKLVKRETVAKEIAVQEFEEILRGLKTELRRSVYELCYIQSFVNLLFDQSQSLTHLIESYKKQVLQGNMAKSELLRLQSSLLELESELNDARLDLTEQEKILKVLLNITPSTRIEIVPNLTEEVAPNSILLPNLLQIADESRTDMKQYRLRTQYYERALDYEKSLRAPDITIGASYDHYGGVWKNFVGIGVSVDLPVFNRNQGGIKAAKLGIEQSRYREQQQQNIVRHEVAAAYDNYAYAYDFYKKIHDESLQTELDEALKVYAKNLLNKNISMFEYIDFMESYRASKQTILAAKRNVDVRFEELQYTVGTEIK